MLGIPAPTPPRGHGHRSHTHPPPAVLARGLRTLQPDVYDGDTGSQQPPAVPCPLHTGVTLAGPLGERILPRVGRRVRGRSE